MCASKINNYWPARKTRNTKTGSSVFTCLAEIIWRSGIDNDEGRGQQWRDHNLVRIVDRGKVVFHILRLRQCHHSKSLSKRALRTFHDECGYLEDWQSTSTKWSILRMVGQRTISIPIIFFPKACLFTPGDLWVRDNVLCQSRIFLRCHNAP